MFHLTTWIEFKRVITKDGHIWSFAFRPYPTFMTLVWICAGLWAKSRIVSDMPIEDVDGHKMITTVCFVGAAAFALLVISIKRTY